MAKSGHSAHRDLIVIGASAGGVQALSELVSQLGPSVDAAILIVMHFPTAATSVLPRILARAGRMPAAHAIDRARIEKGTITIAPPGLHMVVADGGVRLIHGPQQNGHRPSIDALFRSVAHEYGRRAIGVVLSGLLDDGTAGLAAIKRRGGTTVVQDPQDAQYPDMPRNAIENVPVDHVLPVARMGACLLELLAAELPPARSASADDDLDYETAADRLEARVVHPSHPSGEPSTFTCPDCGGALWELVGDEPLRFRCYVGHGFTSESLESLQRTKEERALWTSLRTLEESARLSQRLEERMSKRGQALSAADFRLRAAEALESAEVIRQILLHRHAEAVQPPAPPVDDDTLAEDKEDRQTSTLDPDEGTD